MDHALIRPMAQRHYQKIPVDKVRVITSRKRDKKQAQENARSIGQLGMYKPIIVNQRHLSETGFYDLICGEGRLQANIDLGKPDILAEIVDVDDATAHLMTLGENIARTPPRTIEFARAIKEMHDGGMSLDQLAAITGKCTAYLQDYIRLLDQGEERLIQGVEDGFFPIGFAMSVAESKDGSVQDLLMDAFDSGLVNARNLSAVRRIIEERLNQGGNASGGRPGEKYGVERLRSDIRQVTREKESYVSQVSQRENRLIRILVTLKHLRGDAEFEKLLTVEGLGVLPELKGQYGL